MADVNADMARVWSDGAVLPLETEGKRQAREGAMAQSKIKVGPVAGGWIVDGVEGLEPLIFRSGARAEAHARALALVIAQGGSDADVAVLDRRDRPVGAYRFRARDHEGDA